MRTPHFVGNAQKPGDVVWEAFPSWAQFTWLYLVGAITALRGATLFHFGVEGWEMWMLGAGILLMCAVILRRWARYELTRERVSVRNGYTGREIASVPLADVRAVTVQQGIVAGLFGIGTLSILSSLTDRSVSLRGIRDPEEIKVRIEASASRQKRPPPMRVPEGER